MTNKASEKIIEALSMLLEGFAELQENLEEEVEEDEDEDEEEEVDVDDLEVGLVNEVRSTLEAVMESEDYSAADFANLLNALTSALEEIDPTVFEVDEEELEGEEDEDEDYDLDDFEDEDDDLEFDEDEDEDEEEDDEDFEDEDEEEEDEDLEDEDE